MVIKKRPNNFNLNPPRLPNYFRPEVFFYRIVNLNSYGDSWGSPLCGHIGTVFSSYDDPDRARNEWITPIQSIYGGTFMRGNLAEISYKEFARG